VADAVISQSKQAPGGGKKNPIPTGELYYPDKEKPNGPKGTSCAPPGTGCRAPILVRPRESEVADLQLLDTITQLGVQMNPKTHQHLRIAFVKGQPFLVRAIHRESHDPSAMAASLRSPEEALFKAMNVNITSRRTLGPKGTLIGWAPTDDGKGVTVVSIDGESTVAAPRFLTVMQPTEEHAKDLVEATHRINALLDRLVARAQGERQLAFVGVGNDVTLVWLNRKGTPAKLSAREINEGQPSARKALGLPPQ
jgi:hypothetical protein